MNENEYDDAQDQAMDELFKPLLPLREQALDQLDGNEDNFYEWAVLAASTHHLRPEVPMSKLLPDQLDDTIHDLGGEFQDELAEFIDDEEEE